jgi:hypothetical protein
MPLAAQNVQKRVMCEAGQRLQAAFQFSRLQSTAADGNYEISVPPCGSPRLRGTRPS